jgi:hypothetical protein
MVIACPTPRRFPLVPREERDSKWDFLGRREKEVPTSRTEIPRGRMWLVQWERRLWRFLSLPCWWHDGG